MIWYIWMRDDDAVWLREGESILQHYAQRNGMKVKLKSISETDHMLCDGECVPDVVFLDIELEGENGIETAEKINRVWPACQIVFLTNYIQYAVDVYQVRHTFFVLKEQFESRLEQVFSALERNREKSENRLYLTTADGAQIFIREEEICYAERQLRITRIHTEEGIYEVKERIEEMMSRLSGNDFVRCHNSIVVNLRHVRRFHRSSFEMNDGTQLTVSRSYQKQVRGQVAEWIRT